MENIKNLNVLINQVQGMSNQFKAFKDTEDLLKVLNVYQSTCADFEARIKTRQEELATIDDAIAAAELKKLDSENSVVLAGDAATHQITSAKILANQKLAELEQQTVAAENAAEISIREAEKRAKTVVSKVEEVIISHKKKELESIKSLDAVIAAKETAISALNKEEADAKNRLAKAEEQLKLFISALGSK